MTVDSAASIPSLMSRATDVMGTSIGAYVMDSKVLEE